MEDNRRPVALHRPYADAADPKASAEAKASEIIQLAARKIREAAGDATRFDKTNYINRIISDLMTDAVLKNLIKSP